MSKVSNYKKFFLAAGALLATGVGSAAHAAITINQMDSTSGTFSTWAVTPNAGDTTGTNSVNISQFTVPENNFGPQNGFTVPTGGSLGQSITATTSGTLTDIQILVTGNISGITFNLALYDAGTAGVTGLANESTAGYGNNIDILQNSGTGLVTSSSNLLSSLSQGLAAPAYNTSGATAAVLDFQLSGADAVSLIAGHEYIIEINTPSNSANFFWYRNGGTGDYATGQAFRSRAPLNGNPARDFAASLVVTPSAVPEPASLGMLAVGALTLMARRRKA